MKFAGTLPYRASVALISGSALALLMAAPALAAPPLNDMEADPATLAVSPPVSVDGTTVEATAEPNESHWQGQPAENSVWYAWTPNISRAVTFDTCTSSFDTRVAVYIDSSIATFGYGAPTYASDTLELQGSSDDNCPGGPNIQGSAVTITVDPGTTYMIAVDGHNGQGTFTLSLTATPPSVPDFDSTSPASPANFNDPRIQGDAQSGTTVTLYTDPACTGTPAAVGTAAQFSAPGLLVSVADNSINTYYADATDGGGDTSACSGPIIYVEQTLGAPDPPMLVRTDPLSPAPENNPRVIGTAPVGSTVTIWSGTTCGAPQLATGTAAQFANPGLTVFVADGAEVTLSATATDGGGITSACSGTVLTYLQSDTGGGGDETVVPPTLRPDPPNPATSNPLKKKKKKKKKKKRKKRK